MKDLFCIFNGEFGWEVMQWQAYCRKLSREYQTTYVYTTNLKSYPLYADFAVAGLPDTKFPVLRHTCNNISKEIPFEEQEFIPFGEVQDTNIDILIHARHRCERKDYPYLLWEEVVKELGRDYKIASIGTHATYVIGTVNLLSISLSDLFNYMASVKLILGPSSGPMHLASLCGCPHLVWGSDRQVCGKMTLDERYKDKWNPFGTACSIIMGDDWFPPPEQIVKEARRLLQ